MNEPCFCPTCGTVLEELQRRLDEQDQTIGELGRALAAQRIQNHRLRHQQMAVPPDLHENVDEVCQYWKAKLAPSARELNGTRASAVCERLQHGYTVEDLKRCIDGYTHRPFLKYGNWVPREQGGVFKADLKFIMADASRVDEGLRIAERYDPRPPAQVSLPL